MGIAQLVAHEVDGCILCHEGCRYALPYGQEGRQVCATLLGVCHVPERLCGGRVYLGRYNKCSTFTFFYLPKLLWGGLVYTWLSRVVIYDGY